MLFFISLYYFLYSVCVYVAAYPASEENLNEDVTAGQEYSTSTINTNVNGEPESKKNHKTVVFDLTQEASNQYMSNDAFKSLEAMKGMEYSAEHMIKFKIWPQGIIPYFIDSLSFDKILSDKIREYLDVVNSLTGLRFREEPRPPADDQTRWVLFLNRNGWSDCWDYSDTEFTNTGVQRVVIGYDCLGNGGHMADVVMGLLGIPQQHNAPDRDSYVQYNEQSVMADKTNFYTKIPAEDWLFKDIEYDFLSVTHLPLYKNSMDGSAVLKPLVPVSLPIGETKGFSFSDLQKIRLMYNSITSKSDEKIQLSNCQKLYRPGNKGVVNEDTTFKDVTNNDDDKKQANTYNNNEQQQTNEPPQEANNGETKENEVDAPDNDKFDADKPIEKTNRSYGLKMRGKGKMRVSTDDPLKWQDVNSDDK